LRFKKSFEKRIKNAAAFFKTLAGFFRFLNDTQALNTILNQQKTTKIKQMITIMTPVVRILQIYVKIF